MSFLKWYRLQNGIEVKGTADPLSPSKMWEKLRYFASFLRSVEGEYLEEVGYHGLNASDDSVYSCFSWPQWAHIVKLEMPFWADGDTHRVSNLTLEFVKTAYELLQEYNDECYYDENGEFVEGDWPFGCTPPSELEYEWEDFVSQLDPTWFEPAEES